MTLLKLFKRVSPVLVTVLFACGDGNSQPAFWPPVDTGEDDATTDVVDDTSEDPAADTAEDAETDAERDTAEDAETDAERDTAEDVETDAEEDAAEDVETDAEEDAAVDTEEDAAVDAEEDSGVPDADIDLCPVARRCDFRIVETCDPETGLFSEETVCERDQRCQRGRCESLPRTYESACRVDDEREACDAAGLACGGFSAVPMCLHPDNPQDLGEACYGSRDCNLGLLCTRMGFCSEGDAGDPCREPEDCHADRGGCGRDGRCR